MPDTTLTIGTAKDPSGNSTPHQVTVGAFWIMAHEVTQEQYRLVTKARPSHFAGKPDHPVEKVRWSQAVIFCNKLSALEGRDSCYKKEGETYRLDLTRDGYRLPTEAEWEYACGGAGLTDTAIARRGWYADNAGLRTHAVKSLEPNRFGLYDMLGNVWEWCTDWYAPFGEEARVDPAGPSTGEAKVVRGGGWWSVADELDAKHRSFTRPDYHFKFLGFRCVRSDSR
jgi:formylglycine-generating enzyme required for sulfatase activity